MEAAAQPSRRHYQPDGVVVWSRIPLFVLVGLVPAVSGAWLLNFLLQHGFYIVFVVPSALAALLAAVVWSQCGVADCRSVPVAAAIGLACGLVFYLGSYQVGMLEHLPPGQGARIDLLPRYIHLRMLTDTKQNRRNRGDAVQQPSPVTNYLMFAVELGLCAAIPAIVGGYRARRPYSAAFGCWLKRESLVLVMGHAEAIECALLAGTVRDYLAHTPRSVDKNKACTLYLDYVNQPDVSPLSQPAYLSVEDQGERTDKTTPPHKTLLGRPLELTTQELLSIYDFYPRLKASLEAHHQELHAAPAIDMTQLSAQPPHKPDGPPMK